MAAITPTNVAVSNVYRPVNQCSGTSSANQADTLTSPTTGFRKLKYVTCSYSGAPTQAGVTISLKSGLGAGYDCVLTTGAANTRYNPYVPADEVIYLLEGDAIQVAAPAGGGLLTAAIVIVTEAV